MPDDSEIVRDKHDREPALAATLHEHVEDLRLDRSVEPESGVVREQHLGITDERHGDDDALGHAAGKLMGIGFRAVLGIGDADLAKDIDGAGVGRPGRDRFVRPQHPRDLTSHRRDRIEKRLRVGADQGDAAAAQVSPLLALEAG